MISLCSVGYTLLAVALLAGSQGIAIGQNLQLSDLPGERGVVYWGNEPNSVAQQSVAPAGDFNGDGFSDLLFGSAIHNPASQAFLVTGKAQPALSYDMRVLGNGSSASGFRVTKSSGRMAFNVSDAGDFNGDGFNDFIIPTESGQAYLVFGRMGPFNTFDVASLGSNPQHGVLYSSQITAVTAAMGVGDVNNDGYDDVAVAGRDYAIDYSQTKVGKVWVIFGRPSGGTIDLDGFQTSDQNGYTILGQRIGMQFGYVLSPVGDFNNDGFSDFAVGGMENMIFGQSAGRHMIVLGAESGIGNIDLYNDRGTLPMGCLCIERDPLLSTFVQTAVGTGVDVNMDFNGDGYSDFLMGAMHSSNTGVAFVVYGSDDETTAIPTTDLATTTTHGLRIAGVTGENVGISYSWAGDVNADGLGDIILNVRNGSYNGLTNSGCSYVIYGKTEFSAPMNLGSNFSVGLDGFRVDGPFFSSGMSVISSAAGDVNGDTVDDFIFSYFDPPSSLPLGRNYLIFGQKTDASVTDWVLW